MARGLRFVWLLAVIAAFPVLAADDAKKDAEKKDAEKKDAPPAARSPLAPQAKESKYQSVGKVTGRFRAVDQGDRTVSVEVAGRREAQDFALAEDVKVRTNILPVQLDEKDRPKRLTQQEKQKLKGDDPKLPGYTAELTSLTRGQVVEVHLSKLKGTAAKKPATPDKKAMTKDMAKDKAAPKEKGKAMEKDTSVDRDVLVTMIVVVSQDNPPGKSGARPGKK